MADKYYVVWEGRTMGIFEEWSLCKASIEGHEGAMYKCFYSLEAAHKAFDEGFEHYWGKDVNERTLFMHQGLLVGEPVEPSLCVEALWQKVRKAVSYRGVDTSTGKELFRQGPYTGGTLIAGEYLALVHALAYLKKEGSNIPVYTESRYAPGWVRVKRQYCYLKQTAANQSLCALLDRADDWLANNSFENRLLRWESKVWGTNPASFNLL